MLDFCLLFLILPLTFLLGDDFSPSVMSFDFSQCVSKTFIRQL